jgi:hypothetical protein
MTDKSSVIGNELIRFVKVNDRKYNIYFDDFIANKLGSLFLTEWLVKTNDYVTAGDLLFDIFSYSKIKVSKAFSIVSPFSGKIEVLDPKTPYDKLKEYYSKNVLIGNIYLPIEIDTIIKPIALSEDVTDYYAFIPQTKIIGEFKIYLTINSGTIISNKNHIASINEMIIGEYSRYYTNVEELGLELTDTNLYNNLISFEYDLSITANGIFDLNNNQSLIFINYENSNNSILLFRILKNTENILHTKYANEIIIQIDEFTKNTNIKWGEIGGITLYQSNLNKFSAIISQTEFNEVVNFTFEYQNEKDFIVFNFPNNGYNLKTNDRIMFLFENDIIVSIPVVENSSITKMNFDNYELQLPITFGELEIFANQNLKRWRICFESKNKTIDCLIENNYYSNSLFQYILRDLVSKYIHTVSTEINNYKPLLNRKQYAESPTDENCYVYLMRDLTNNYYKIGISNSPKYREKTLQAEKPSIELVIAKKYPNRKIAESFEKALHQTYSEKRIRGEWFELDEKEIENIITTLK